MQENPIPGIDWAFECVLDAQGLAPTPGFNTILATTYTQGEWVSFTHHIDTDTDEMQLFIDGVFARAFPFDGISIGGINFYAAGDGATEPTYYVDDISVNPLEELQTIACTDSNACNYDETATLSDVNACEFPGDACNDGDSGTINDFISENCECLGDFFLGCTDPEACNYNPVVTENDGSCTYLCGCTDPSACNYDVTALEDDGSCCECVDMGPLPLLNQTWKFSSVAGAIAIGPDPGSTEWYASPADGLVGVPVRRPLAVLSGRYVCVRQQWQHDESI